LALPIPLVKGDGGWRFDTAAGKREILSAASAGTSSTRSRSAGATSRPRRSTPPSRAAVRRPCSTPSASSVHRRSRTGLAWRDADGTWRGPVGEAIARAISEGYSSKSEPYHGYYFKILMGQGPTRLSAPSTTSSRG
jgi:hypothetical protein